MKDPEILERLPGPVSQFEHRDIGSDVEIGIVTTNVEYFELRIKRDTVFNPSEITFPLGPLVYVPIRPGLANPQIVEKTVEELMVKIWDTNTRGEPVQTTAQDSNKFGLVKMMFFLIFQSF